MEENQTNEASVQKKHYYSTCLYFLVDLSEQMNVNTNEFKMHLIVKIQTISHINASTVTQSGQMENIQSIHRVSI